MGSTTAAPQAERLVATPAPEDAMVLFMSRRGNLRLTKTPRYPERGPNGQQVGETVGETVEFRDNVLRVPQSGKAVLEMGREIDAKELLEWLRGHRLYDDLADGFWEVDLPAPTVSIAERDTLLEIVAAQDEERLVAFIEQEREGWAREDLIASAEKALESLRERSAGGGGS